MCDGAASRVDGVALRGSDVGLGWSGGLPGVME